MIKLNDCSQQIQSIIEVLLEIENDDLVPKNIRIKIRGAISALQDDRKETDVKINCSLQELDDLNENANVPQYTRTQIWNIVSTLESIH